MFTCCIAKIFPLSVYLLIGMHTSFSHKPQPSRKVQCPTLAFKKSGTRIDRPGKQFEC